MAGLQYEALMLTAKATLQSAAQHLDSAQVAMAMAQLQVTQEQAKAKQVSTF